MLDDRKIKVLEFEKNSIKFILYFETTYCNIILFLYLFWLNNCLLVHVETHATRPTLRDRHRIVPSAPKSSSAVSS